MNENQPTLLLIEDSPEDREVIRLYLGEDYRTIEADCGERGLALAAAVQPACVLLDYFLPDMDGLEFLTARGPGHDTEYAVLILTGNEAVDVAVACLKQGAHDFLIKGRFTSDGLRHAVHHGIETVGLQRENALQQRELERAFAAVQASETRLQLMIEHAPAALAIPRFSRT